MIYVFLGNEVNLLKNRVDELIRTLEINNVIKFDYDSVGIIDILNEVNYVDLFNERKLIVVSNFTFKKIKEKEEKELLKYIDNMNDNVIIFKCIDETLDSKKNLIKKFKEKCKIEEVKKLDYKNLHEYVSNMFKDANIKISYDQIKKILNMADYNNDFAINEAKKLIMYKDNQGIVSDKDIDDVISKNNEKEMFKLNDAVLEKNIAKMFESYKVLVSSGVDAVVIIDNLAKQFRNLYQIKVLNKSMGAPQISAKLGLMPFVIKKLLDNISNFSEDELIGIMYKLSEMDIDIKVRGIDKNKVLEMFFISL